MRAALITLALVAGGARAEFMDGNTLLGDLRGDTPSARSFGLGYIVGVADALRNVAFCPPDNVTAGQIRDMVRNYLDNTPAARHHTGDVIVTNVLKSVWPCAARPGRGGTQL